MESQQIEMNFEKKAGDSLELEYEYHCEVKFIDFQLDNIPIEDIEIIYIFAQLMEKVEASNDDTKTFIFHGTPIKISQFLSENSLRIILISKSKNRNLGKKIIKI